MFSKEEIEERLTTLLKQMLSDYNQESGFVSLTYDEETEKATVVFDVVIVEEDNYVGFEGY